MPATITAQDFIIVVTTFSTRDEARRVAQTLVERRLVACAQISEIESIYHWQNAVHHDPEFRLLLKTTRATYAPVEAAIRELHSYELPAIHALALDAISAPYAEWIASSIMAD